MTSDCITIMFTVSPMSTFQPVIQVRREREARMKLQAQEQHRYQQQHLLISNLQLPGQLAGNKVPGILEGTRHDPVPISSQHNPFTV